jgi:hypothetical protein
MSGRDKRKGKYLKSNQIILVGCMLILLSLACNMPLVARQEDDSQQQQPGFVETSIAETMVALGREPDVGDQSGGEDEVLPPTATFTPENTETPTLTPTVTDMPTPEIPQVYVSENTNCRSGPGKVYDWLTTVQQGQEVEAVARDPIEEYWYIRRPDQESAFCWLWGRYATPEGDTASLPVFTPPPTPTPGLDFSVSYISQDGPCPQWALLYRINNIGALTLESWKTTAVDHTGGSNPDGYDDDSFLEVAGCGVVSSQQDLTPGESHYVMMTFNGNPNGHDITTKIKICTKNGLAGECITKNIRHTP